MSTFADATKGSLTDKDVEVAKAQLKSAYLMWTEDSGNLLEDVGTQAAALGSVAPIQDVLQQLDAVTAADVNKVKLNSFAVSCTVMFSSRDRD